MVSESRGEMKGMTSRERWLAAINHKVPDRLPMAYSATPEFTEKLMRHLGCGDEQELMDRLGVDKQWGVWPDYVGPPLAKGETVFGARFDEIDYGLGVYTDIDGKCTYNPLAKYKTVAEIEANYTWPSPDWWDYSDIRAQVEGKEDWVITGGASEPFMDYKEQLRGPEQSFVDLIENPEIVHYCLGKMYDLCYEQTRRIYEQIPGKVMITYVAEDMGTQQSLLYSPGQIREFFLPHMKRMIDLAHQAGAYVMHHSDGAVRAILPDMVAAGIDMLDPIQWRCKGMEREGLKRDFGDKIVFHGAMDNQYTLAFGSEGEVRQEVRDNIEKLGRESYILAPCHMIQPVSSVENIVAMYDEARQYGEY